MSERARDHDIVVYGATGFVGVLTAEYLAEQAPADVRIALGGRSEAKLEQTRAELGVDWPLVVADSQDRDAVAALAESARVVATTVGPYFKYGKPLVEACAAAGTHYADLTGEVLFMRWAIDAADATARASGARHRPHLRLRLDPIRHRHAAPARGGAGRRAWGAGGDFPRGQGHEGRRERRDDRLGANDGRHGEEGPIRAAASSPIPTPSARTARRSRTSAPSGTR